MVDQIYKVIIVGEASVGKTSLILRYIRDEFNDEYLISQHAQEFSRNIYLDKQTAKVHVWDTCGQEKFRALNRKYYADAHGAVVVFDMTNKTTYNEVIKYWIRELEENAPEELVIYLVGNKSDERVNREVSEDEAQQFADKSESVFAYDETSAKDSTNVDDVFERLVFEIHKRQKESFLSKRDTHKLTKKEKKKSSTCCRNKKKKKKNSF